MKGPRIYVADSDEGLDAFSSEVGMPARRTAPPRRSDPDPLEEFEIQRARADVPVDLGPPAAPPAWAAQEPVADGPRLIVVGLIGLALTAGVLMLLLGPIWAPAPTAVETTSASSAAPASAPAAESFDTGTVTLGPENAALPPLDPAVNPLPAPPSAPVPVPIPAAEPPFAEAPRGAGRVAIVPPATVPAPAPASPAGEIPERSAPVTPAPIPTASAAPVGSPTAFGGSPPAATAVPRPVPLPPVQPSAVTPPPPPVAAPPRAAPAPAASSASAAPVAPAVPPIEVESAAIQNVLGRYRTAFNRLDVVGATTVWPTVDQQGLERAFGQLEEQEVTFDECLIEIRGAAAEASCKGTASYVPRVGRRAPQTDQRRWTFNLRKAGEGWLIAGVTAR